MMENAGALTAIPKECVGVFLVSVTIGVFALAVRAAALDMKNDLQTSSDGDVETSTIELKSLDDRSYRKGEYIVCHGANSSERFTMSPQDFATQFHVEYVEDRTSGDRILPGFQRYQQTGRVWAIELTSSDISTHFPSGQFLATWGSPTRVRAGDLLVIPYPSGGQLYCIGRTQFAQGFKPAFTSRVARSVPGGRVPSQAEVLSLWQSELQQPGQIYIKTAKVHAKEAHENGSLDTVANGGRKKYSRGDFIVCGMRGARYTMAAVDFSLSYDSKQSQLANDQLLESEGFKL